MKQLTQTTGITHESHIDTNNAYNAKFSKLMMQFHSDSIVLSFNKH